MIAERHVKVEKSFLLLRFSVFQVIHILLFEIIGEIKGVQCWPVPDIEAIETTLSWLGWCCSDVLARARYRGD